MWGRICSKPASSLSALGVKDPHSFVLCKQCEQFLKLAPTSKKDAPHSCLISLGWRQECTTSGRGVPFRVTNPCDWSKSQKLPPKADNTFDGHYPQKRLFVGEDLFQARKQFVRFGAKGPTRLCPLQATWAIFETCFHIEERCPTHAL